MLLLSKFPRPPHFRDPLNQPLDALQSSQQNAVANSLAFSITIGPLIGMLFLRIGVNHFIMIG